MGEERPWEKSYPPGVRWDAPIEMATAAGDVRRFHRAVGAEAGARISRPHDELRRAARGGRRRRLGPHGPRRAARARRSRSTCPTRPTTPSRSSPRSSAAARVVHLSPLDAERELAFKLKDSGARILVTTNIGFMALMAQKLKAGWPRRPSDRRRRHGLRPLGHPDHADRGRRRRSSASTRCAQDGAGEAAAAVAEGRRRGHRAAAIHRRHHRQAQGRHAHPRQPQRRLRDLQGLGRSAAHLRARRGQGHLRPAAVPHLRADRRDAARPARGQRAAAARALRRGDDAQRYRGQEGDRVPRRADHVDRARQHARTSTSATSPRCAMSAPAARRCRSRWPSASRSSPASASAAAGA